MDTVPPYPLVYLWQIRKHSGEPGYLKRRFQTLSPERAVYEKSMLRELFDLHLIAKSSEEKKVAINQPIGKKIADELGDGSDAIKTFSIWPTFTILARGHYIWMEYLASGFRWLLASLLGALIALVITGR